MTVTCVIPSRLGSTRFPGKPLYKINGKEMILHVIDRAMECKYIDNIVVATPDEEIYNVVKQYNCDAIITDSCSTCTHRVSDAVRLLEYKPRWVVNLQGDEPVMNPESIDDMIGHAMTHQTQMLQAVYNINQIDVDDKDCVKAVINNDNVIWITRTPEPEWIINRHIFGISGLYVYDYDTIANFRSYDLKMVEDCASLDTLGFIGKIPVTPFNIGMRTHAVDRPSDIEIVKHEIRR